VLETGGFVVAYAGQGQDGSGYGIFARKFKSDGKEDGDEFQVNTITANDQINPDAVALNSGRFAVAWSSYISETLLNDVFSRRFNGNGAEDLQEFQVNDQNADNQHEPKVVSWSDGGFVAVWNSLDQDGSMAGIFGKKYKPDGSIDKKEFQINTYIEGDQTSPYAASFPDGRFIVVWSGLDMESSEYRIFGKIFSIQGVAEDIDFKVSDLSGSQQKPVAITFKDGRFAVAWACLHEKITFLDIYARRFKTDGTKDGSEIKVNFFPNGDQTSPSAASFDDGGFVVVWQSCPSNEPDEMGQDGNMCGIFAQRFDKDGYKIIK
jgi:hypothetical protein